MLSWKPRENSISRLSKSQGLINPNVPQRLSKIMTKSAYWFSKQKVVSDLGDDDFNLVVNVEPSMEAEE